MVNDEPGQSPEQSGFDPLIRGKPLPVQLARALTERIHSGDLTPGTKVPAEPQLAAQFGVSRATVREATRLLVGEGLLETRRGKGTFVRYPVSWPVNTGLEELVSMTELIEREGYKAATQVLERGSVEATVEVASALNVTPGERVHFLQRIRLADDMPVAHCRDYVNAAVLPAGDLLLLDGSTSLLGSLQTALGRTISGAVTHIQPVLPSTEIRKMLSVANKEALLMLRETYYVDHDEPILYSENIINSRLLSFHVRRSPRPRLLGSKGEA